MKIDFHIHSYYSQDSLARPADILKVAEKKRLQGLAITDHDSLYGSIQAQKIIKEKRKTNIMLIPGMEISTNKGDLLALFITEEVKNKNWEDAIDEIHNQEGIAVIPHPYHRCHLEAINFSSIDGIEVFNAHMSYEKNKKAYCLAEKFQKPKIGGSDAHLLREIGRSITDIPLCQDLDEIRRTILKGKTRVSGTSSSLLLQDYSQIVKCIKTKQYFNIFRRGLVIAARYKRKIHVPLRKR